MRKLRRCLHTKTPLKTPLYDLKIQQFLQGRIWIEEELPFLQDIIRYHKTQRWIIKNSGIQQKQCMRCHSKRLHEFWCKQCEGHCAYCLNCLKMGRVSNCTNLIRWCGPTYKNYIAESCMTWKGTLTDSQQRVVKECTAHEKDHLIHAVTGAGKTEMLFPIIEDALKKGKRVCIATPRTDVVLELMPRIQQAFSTIPVQAFYGGSGFSLMYSPLIIATTHQLLRFQQAFDLILVDEADAFPYTYDEALQFAVKKALKDTGRTILVTATPTKNERQKYEKQQTYSFLSRRFHGFDLPVPRFVALFSYKKSFRKNHIPKRLSDWVESCITKQQPFLLFFPTIELMESAAPLFQQLHENLHAVHASDDHRKERVQALRKGDVPGLLTTTILERGITIENLQVAVLGADETIFNASALIQISGRAGRSKEYPTGDVCFFHAGITRQMDLARNEIIRLNREEVIKQLE